MSVVHRCEDWKPGVARYLFFCPGCRTGHCFWTPPWTFNGDMEKPTVRASLLVTQPSRFTCHSFVTDGNIEFLSDCTHPLAGQTVALPDLDDDVEDLHDLEPEKDTP